MNVVTKGCMYWSSCLLTTSRKAPVSLTSYRRMSTAEIMSALKPFYFSVHPDLFGQYPFERATNETSLQYLSSFIENLKNNKPCIATTLTFYLRPQGTVSNGDLRCVKIHLKERSIHHAVTSVLASCNLPTTYVDSLAKKRKPPEYDKDKNSPYTGRYTKEQYEQNDFEDATDIEFKIRRERYEAFLQSWLKENAVQAKKRLESCMPIKEEVDRLKKSITFALGLKSLGLDCGWNVGHYRGCLSSFQELIQNHPEEMRTLKGRSIVFGRDTGVTFDGVVSLNSAEVRNNWLDFIKNISEEDRVVKKLPSFEKAVSRVLRDIKIVRRKFQPKRTAIQYENNLRRLMTSLNDYQGRFGYPKQWPLSLQDYELVVETEAGPLMVSPTGQFIVPSSCPSFLLISFITDNLEEAKRLNHHYQSHKHIEKNLIERCIKGFQLSTLEKDDCITPDLMIQCCSRLLDNKQHLDGLLNGSYLYVANYYSIMSDGQICIPWNWNL